MADGSDLQRATIPSCLDCNSIVNRGYDTYWRFAAERQSVFFRRLLRAPQPWSDDEILQTYKFTNAYRASDRVSQYLIRNVIYRGSQAADEVFYRTILFKIFNKIETWELLERELGQLVYSEFSYERYEPLLTAAMERGQRIYSAAYIMPPGTMQTGSTKKHQHHLRLLECMMNDGAAYTIASAPSMQAAYDVLKSYPTIGSFLAFLYVTDLNYSNICDFSEMELVVPGPGAIDGISKCFSSLGGLTEAELITLVTERQEGDFDRLGLDFPNLWGRPLQLVDCQNLFCEISKYARIRHPTVKGVANRPRGLQNEGEADDTLAALWPLAQLVTRFFRTTLATIEMLTSILRRRRSIMPLICT